jgi:DNA polymerase-3 subunit epsilon
MEGLQLNKPLVFLDLETTGISISKDKIIEISIIKFNPDDSEVEKTVRVNPGIPIPQAATAIHGITDEDVANEPSFHRYAKSFFDFITGCDIGGFNVLKFDVPLLQQEFSRCSLSWDVTDVYLVDPMVIFHKKEPRDLSAAYKKYCGVELEGAHQAVTDARAAKDVLIGQMTQYSDIGNTVEELHAFCNPREPNWIDDEGKLVLTDDGPAINFGKFAGQLISEVVKTDREYLNWILDKDFAPLVKQTITKVIEDTP